MSEWKRVKLRDCIEEINEKTTKNNQYEVLSVTKDGIFSQEEFFKKQIASVNNIGYKIIRKNNLVFSTMNLWMGSLDVLTNYDIGIVSPAYKVFEFNENLMISEYGNYFMKSYYMLEQYKSCSEQGASVVRRNLDLKALLNIEINIPPIEEQEKIVKILKNIDSIINRYKKLLEEKNQFINSQFVEMFLKNEFPKEKLENNVEEMFIGPFGSALKNKCFVEENNGYCVVYEQKHAIYKNIEDFRWIDKDKYESLKRFNVQPKDIIVSCRGTIGKIFVIPENAPLGIMHPSIMKIRLKKEKYIPEFFEMLLQHYFHEKENQTNGATIKMGIKASTLEKEDFIIPDMELQIKYLTFVKQIDKQKLLLEQQKQNYEKLKIGLMQKLLTGKVRVKI